MASMQHVVVKRSEAVQVAGTAPAPNRRVKVQNRRRSREKGNRAGIGSDRAGANICTEASDLRV